MMSVLTSVQQQQMTMTNGAVLCICDEGTKNSGVSNARTGNRAQIMHNDKWDVMRESASHLDVRGDGAHSIWSP